MRTRLAFGENSHLIVFGQSNVAMALAMDVREHRASDKEGVFVDSGILAFCYTRQFKNPLP